MTRSLLMALVACLAGAVAMGIPYGTRSALGMLALLASVALATLLGAHLAAARRARIGGLGRQFTVGVALVVGAILLAVWIGAMRMFVSPHDALMVAVVATVAGVVAVRAGQLLAAGVLRDIEALRDGLRAVGEGERGVRIEPGGRDELADLAHEANAMIARLDSEQQAREAADGARRRLVASVSHDLRTPLASLRLLVEAVEDGVATGATRTRYLSEMHTHVAVLSDLIDDLFELSRIEAGDIAWTMRQVELGELVNETVAAMRVHAQAHGVDVTAELPSEGVRAEVNAEKLQRVLLNLILNAIRHTPPDGSVTVRAGVSSEGVEVEVADDGAGIAAEERERVFEPFHRGDSGAGDGAGLGLAISRAIVEAHGGRIWLEPAASGTCVRFTLPA